MRIFIWYIATSLILSSSYAQEKNWETRIELAYVKTGGNTETETISSKLSIGMSYLVKIQNVVPRPEIETTDTAFMSSLIINL